MRLQNWLLLVPLIMGVPSCDDAPATANTAPTRLGRTTLADFRAEPSSRVWFESAYEAYPGTAPAARTRFDEATAAIAATYDSSDHTVLMVVRPDCPCHSSQELMPAAVKSLLAAGVHVDRVTVYVTNAKMEGIDELRSVHRPAITEAPAFIIMRDGVEKGRVTGVPPGSSVEQELARHFAAP
jgi:hypothetical protein